MAEENAGYLIVLVTTAINTIPVAGSRVVISETKNGSESTVYILETDISGRTDKIPLYAPPKEASLVPNPTGPVYSLYNLTVYKEGYYPQSAINVPIFQGITSFQGITLYPLTAGNFIGAGGPSPEPGVFVDEEGAGMNI